MSDLTAWLRVCLDEDELIVLAVDLDELGSLGVDIDTYGSRAINNYLSLIDTEAVLKDIEAKRALLDLMASRRHHVEEDCWYTCAAATEERDGGECSNDARRGGPCDCGRDSLEQQVALTMAQIYAGRPGWRTEWRQTRSG